MRCRVRGSVRRLAWRSQLRRGPLGGVLVQITMPAPQISNLRTLRQRRERAQDWINYARWTSIGTAIVGSVLVFVLLAYDPSRAPERLPVLSTLVAQGVVGYKLRERSQWAAWGLMATYVASIATSVLVYSIWSGILGKLAIGFVYARGWLATLEYEDLNKQIAALSAPTTGDAA